jgi:DNA-binding NarL/FixJ family response regulator
MEGENVEKTRRVLIADDRPHSRRGLRAVLNLRPEVVVVGEATDGQEAVRLAEALRPDVILMDAKMPRMDGVEATRLIKERWPEIRVVLLTVHAGYRADALASGTDTFLIKGCTGEELVAAVLHRAEEG